MQLKERDGVWRVAEWPDLVHGFIGNRFDVRRNADLSSNELTDVLQAPQLLLLNQVHGHTLVQTDKNSTSFANATGGSGISYECDVADGWICNLTAPGGVTARRSFGIMTADCAPVIIRQDPLVSILHCGWRGVAGGIIEGAVHRMRSIAGEASSGLKPATAAIGPCAGGCCYEIGPELQDALGEDGIEMRGDRLYLDVATSIAARLNRLNIESAKSEICTICDTRFFSHRRQAQSAGRQLSFVTEISNGPEGLK
jgi:polyphenol oxidase